jgi:nitronate monooxygenase
MMSGMTLRTPFTEMLGLAHPIALAPMGLSSGGALAAAVASAGGLGLVGAASGDARWLDRELPIVAGAAGDAGPGAAGAWGAGFLTWATRASAVEQALSYRPDAIMLSFGDPAPYAGLVRDAGAKLIIQVTDLDEARQAQDAGADVIVAQGTEAGGHGGERGRSTMAFVPVVADLVAPVPVLAAGGIADGRGLAAALCLGAAGALIGTRFFATPEALADPAVTKAIVDGYGEDTARNRVHDILRGSPWPERFPGRARRDVFLDEWEGREQELAADPGARQAYREAVGRGEVTPVPVWASQAIDLITGLVPAADLVTLLAEQAAGALAAAGGAG